MTIILVYIGFFEEFFNTCNFRKVEMGDKGTELISQFLSLLWYDLDIRLLPFED